VVSLGQLSIMDVRVQSNSGSTEPWGFVVSSGSVNRQALFERYKTIIQSIPGTHTAINLNLKSTAAYAYQYKSFAK